MSAAQLERLQEHLQRLRLFKSRERLEALLQEATGKELTYADFLDQVLTEEVASKTAKHVTMRTQLARFPFVKGLDAFDFSYQPSLDKKQLQTLSTCHFIEHGENLVILGPPGVGKTHLAVGLGLKAIERGYRVLFTTAAALIASLTRALTEGRLDERLKLYTVPRLLIIDEIGYLPIDRAGANLFFQLISRRYERGPMILTSNQSFGSWGEVFGDRVIATAILDRILHHAITLNIRGNSYRLKDKLKAGPSAPPRPRSEPGGWGILITAPGEIWVPVDTRAVELFGQARWNWYRSGPPGLSVSRSSASGGRTQVAHQTLERVPPVRAHRDIRMQAEPLQPGRAPRPVGLTAAAERSRRTGCPASSGERVQRRLCRYHGPLTYERPY